MDVVSGCPFWLIKHGFLGVYPALRENLECEVAVIGGGVSGALIGYHLAEAGVNTVLLDKRDIGTGSTAASTSLLQYETDRTLSDLTARFGEAKAVRVYRRCRKAIVTASKLARRVEGGPARAKRALYCASRKADETALKSEYALRRKHGFDVTWWSRERIEAESSLPFPAAIESSGQAELDAYAFTHALVASGTRRQQGLRVFDRTDVRRWRRQRSGKFVLTTAEGFRVTARKIVVAAGYEALGFFKTQPAVCHSTYALVSEPLETFGGWPGRRLIWETARPYLYLRTTSDGRAIIGGLDEPFRDPRARDALLPAKTRALQRKFAELFPDIRMDVAFSWTGTFAETPDSLPYVGEVPGKPGICFALGYGGNGIVFSVIAAEIIRDLCVGETNTDAELFRFGR
jgi:glycine/D-amino acid oxidase-like deaminating enzyme